MAAANNGQNTEQARITLGLLEALERDGAQSQRRLATELNIALGLVNAYLKRCVKKGLVKVQEVPARRYAYYLTPRGFSEKSRLTVEYLTYSFGFFRQAKTDCSGLLSHAKSDGVNKVVLAGHSDLAEIAALCALEHEIEIVGIVAENSTDAKFIGLPVFRTFDAVSKAFDAVLVTDLINARETCKLAVECFGTERVLVPELLRIRLKPHSEDAG
jgi:DNA-binding MarR family transcriptional regulator